MCLTINLDLQPYLASKFKAGDIGCPTGRSSPVELATSPRGAVVEESASNIPAATRAVMAHPDLVLSFGRADLEKTSLKHD